LELKSVVTKVNYYLPPYVFLVDSPRNLPDFLREYTGPLATSIHLPPNTIVVEIVPRYPLPIGISIPDTSLVLQAPFKLSNGDKFRLELPVVRTDDLDTPGSVVLADTSTTSTEYSSMVPRSLLSMRERLRMETGNLFSDSSSRCTVYPTIMVKSEEQDGRKTAVINKLQHQVQQLEAENSRIMADYKQVEISSASAQSQIVALNSKVESLQGVINLLKLEATERVESLNTALISLKKAEYDLSLKKEGFSKSQKDNMSAKVKFDAQIQFLHKQVEYWKTLQIRAAYETDSEKIVTAAALNEPSTSKTSSMIKLAGITKLLSDVAPLDSALHAAPVSPFVETVSTFKSIISSVHIELIESHNADVDWAKSLAEPLLKNFSSPFENDEFSLKTSSVSSPSHSIK
jgi:TolA-binding protein